MPAAEHQRRAQRLTLALAAATEIHAAESYDLDVVVTGLPILSARLSLDSARTMLLTTMLALLAVASVAAKLIYTRSLVCMNAVRNLHRQWKKLFTSLWLQHMHFRCRLHMECIQKALLQIAPIEVFSSKQHLKIHFQQEYQLRDLQ